MKIAKFIDEGGAIEYLILGLLGLGLSVIFERIWFFFIKCRVNSKKLLADTTALIRKEKIAEARKLCNATGTPLGLIMEAGIWKYEQASTAEEIKDALDEVALREVPRLQKRTQYLGLLANLCTLVGLLGTIFGLQEAFAALESADPSQKSKLLARGITLALNATALGLMAAMVCMATFTWLSSKSNQLLDQIDETVLRLVNFLNAQRKTNPDRRPSQTPGSPSSPGSTGQSG
ncbi:MAG: MotA/TolQ/ExbB proton channel family protein [Fibrobacteria bacterium]